MKTKSILCYGDSNTWGFAPGTALRHAPDVRWTGVLQHRLGEGYKVFEEGLSGRTTIWDDPMKDFSSGKKYLPLFLHTHKPLDLVILMLGTNDLKHRFNLSAYDASCGMKELIRIIKESKTGIEGEAPQILVVVPPKFNFIDEAPPQEFEGALPKIEQLAGLYQSVAKEQRVLFFDTAEVVECSVIDGIHLDRGEHGKLGRELADFIHEYFGTKTKNSLSSIL